MATSSSSSATVGGGPKKILYALQTVGRIGVGKAAKALTSRNACKACGLGMGGQMGGMTNEAGEFPSVCNKSIQAQSTDIQPAIHDLVFAHNLADLRELDAFELEHLGRLGKPLFKGADEDRFRIVDWDWAMAHSAARLAATDPARSFFYSSGRSSNEAGFLLQLLARAWGTNNVNNCSYYCHQATGVGLETTIGAGTSTVELDDLDKCDLIFVFGANPASNHPRFIHKLKSCRDRGGAVIMVNPAKEAGLVKFALPKSARSLLSGGSEIASHYLQPKVGSDIALIKGIAKAVLVAGGEDRGFIAAYCEGFDTFATDVAATGWDEIERLTGLPRADIEDVADVYAGADNAILAWGMGMTHHLHGCDNVEYIANLALLRGQIGRIGAGLLPLRGHSNVQGIGTIGVKPVLAEEVVAAMEAHFGVSLPRERGHDTMAALEAAGRGEIDAAIIMGGNLHQATPDSDFATRAFDHIGFKLFLTTTLNRGHLLGNDAGESLILPVAARDEEWQPTTQESMFNFVRLSDGGITRLAEVRPEVTVLADLAERLLPGHAIDFSEFRQHRHIREAIAAIVPGMAELADIDVAKREFHISGRILHTPVFATSDGKAHFQTRATPLFDAEFLLSSIRSEGQFNTIIYERTDSYRGNAARDAILMNAGDMASLGVADGERIALVTSHGRLEGTARTFDIARGGILAYFPEANVLISTEVDPRSKTPAFKSTPVRVERVGVRRSNFGSRAPM